MTAIADVRARAWATRRAKYGPRGHRGSYSRSRAMGDALIRIDNMGGYCPVQAEGEIDGKPFYFRARGSSWSIEIGGGYVLGGEGWSYREPYGDARFAAGWMEPAEARAFIAKAAGLYLAQASSHPSHTSEATEEIDG